VFPEWKEYVPLLIAGVGLTYRDLNPQSWTISDQMSFPILWEWRNALVNEKWLLSSDDCRSWLDDDRPVDIFQERKEILKNNNPAAIGLNQQQYDDLVIWCDEMIKKRTNLKKNNRKIMAAPARPKKSSVEPME
jgi:hypothetical protein